MMTTIHLVLYNSFLLFLGALLTWFHFHETNCTIMLRTFVSWCPKWCTLCLYPLCEHQHTCIFLCVFIRIVLAFIASDDAEVFYPFVCP